MGLAGAIPKIPAWFNHSILFTVTAGGATAGMYGYVPKTYEEMDEHAGSATVLPLHFMFDSLVRLLLPRTGCGFVLADAS